MGRKRNEIVAIFNSVADLNYSKFSVNECRLWFALLAAVRDRDTCDLVMTLDEFAELAGVANHRPAYIVPIAIEMGKKIQALTSVEEWSFGEVEIIWFFQKFKVSLEERRIYFSVSPRYKAWVNSLTANFTKFALTEFKPLSTRAAQELYLQLKKNAFKGDELFISLEDLKYRLNLPKYRSNDITNRIVKPAVSEINSLGAFDKKLTYSAIKSDRKIIGYQFTFISEEDCDDDWDNYSPKLCDEYDEDEPW